MSSSHFCFSHDPKSKKKHLRAAKKGGLALKSNSTVLAEEIDLSSSEGLENVLKDTLSRVRRVNPDGSIELKAAYCITLIVSKLQEIHLKSYPEDRLKEIERREFELREQERAREASHQRHSRLWEENPEKAAEEIMVHTNLLLKRALRDRESRKLGMNI